MYLFSFFGKSYGVFNLFGELFDVFEVIDGTESKLQLFCEIFDVFWHSTYCDDDFLSSKQDILSK